MNFVVLNGSPKKIDLSSTAQYVLYMKKAIPGHDFNFIEIGKDIKKIEKDSTYFNEILKSISKCDALIWSTPVFTYLVPSQLKKFIELVFEKKKQNAFKGKYTTAVLTSAMVCEHTAHNYLHAICEDLGMKFVRGYSCMANTILKEQGRASVKNFFTYFIKTIENKDAVPVRFPPVSWKQPVYKKPVLKQKEKTGKKKILLLSDHQPNSNLERMTETYAACSVNDVEIINLNDIDIKGPCLSCLRCVFKGNCVYKDDIRTLYEEKIHNADAQVFAGTITDRYLSYRWKLFLDRSFFNGHRPILWEKQGASLISGPLRQNPDLLQALETMVLYTRMEMVGFVSDEERSSETTYALIDQLARNMDLRLESGPVFQHNFLSTGAHVILRDIIYSMPSVFREDYRFFKKLKLFDFPQKDWETRIMNIVMHIFFKNPFTGKKIKRDINKYMVMPLQKMIEKI